MSSLLQDPIPHPNRWAGFQPQTHLHYSKVTTRCSTLTLTQTADAGTTPLRAGAVGGDARSSTCDSGLPPLAPPPQFLSLGSLRFPSQHVPGPTWCPPSLPASQHENKSSGETRCGARLLYVLRAEHCPVQRANQKHLLRVGAGQWTRPRAAVAAA